jgi:cytochrome b
LDDECTQALAIKFRAFEISPSGLSFGMNAAIIPVRVWDLPTRIFHWVLAFCVLASIVSAYVGGNAMVWHFRLGYASFALILFRIVWGIVGGHWSRFTNFIYAPSATMRYLRGKSLPGEHHDVGHNPLGAFSVLAFLFLLAVQVGTGLFSDDEISNTGPLINFVSGSTSLALTRWHRNFGQYLIIALIVLHIGAILYYLLRKKKNLIGPMLSGDKSLMTHAPASADNVRTRLVALVLLAICVGVVAWVVKLGG